ncbi:fungal Zn binuclear cluster domain-containing protein [Aspergillus pseudotamarii]|uniref:Fungal Zn binuclear cluster domain-containing protein n=1 Tax=Aspergillus pseudotamarii TaxID=132259 RepID=A0A5N6T1L1_ASPPS|nr:fungal Zn binuclear cluster domain-containing protein [Aspergillus pseudotamarii]KAE8140203.1 fungal Zn binuclear cluster domain-containing protein [Aspergillus pseudotamarii]
MSSRPSLRTRTGCLQCRRRRKKCDETRPRCTGCTRNVLDCEWPTQDNQAPDGRSRRWARTQVRVPALASSGLSLVPLSPPMVMPAPFDSYENAYLYRYFASTILPRLFRQSSLDQTHMLRLAPHFSPLFGAMVAVAGMQLPGTARWPIHFALRGYLHTIHSIQTSLTDITKAGCDDCVLATVILLSVFESCRSDAISSIAPHVTAAGLLLTQRRPRDFRTKAAATFDRICVESFLYHASLMMLFDPSLDALTGVRNELGLPLYFDRLTNPANQPREAILQTSYKFFLLIADVTKLSRLSRPLNSREVTKWWGLDAELSRWIGLISSADISLGLCYLAIQILLQKVNPDITHLERTQRVRSFVEEAVWRVPLLNIESHPPEYLLWPVAILGAVTVRLEERKVLQDFIASVVARKLGGQGAWVQKRLDRIWRTVSPESMTSEPNLVGLQALLDGV